MSGRSRHPRVGPLGLPDRDHPLRRADVDACLSYVRSCESEKHGGVYFLVGPQFSGGAAVLDAIEVALTADALGRHIVRGSLASGAFESAARLDERSIVDRAEDAAKVIDDFVLRFAVPDPARGLIAALIEGSAAALRLLLDEDPSDAATNLSPLAHVLAIAAKSPVVVLVDALDSPNSAWFSQLLADEWAPDVATDVRAVFVASLAGPPEPPSSSAGLPPSLRVATQLTNVKLALWRSLGPVQRDDVARWLSPADASVVEELWKAGGESADLVAATWNDWWRVGGVQLDTGGVIHFAPDADALAASSLRSLAVRRIRSLVPESEDTPFDVLLALELGALQGEAFSVDAVVRVLGVADRDVVMDFLDSRLGSGVGAQAVVAQASEDTTVGADGNAAPLARYRFTSASLWLGLRTRGLAADPRRRYAKELATALRTIYKHDARAIAGTLAALLALADETESAARWQDISEEGSDLELLRWRAHLVLGADHASWTTERCEHGVLLLYRAYMALVWRVPFAESEQYARLGIALADRVSSLAVLGAACRMMCTMHAHRAEYDEAIPFGRRAFAAYKSVPDRWMAARVAFELAAVIDSPHPTGRAGGDPEWLELIRFAQVEGDPTTAAYALVEEAKSTRDPKLFAELIKKALVVAPSRGDGVIARTRAWHLLAEREIIAGDLEACRGLLIREEAALRSIGASNLLCMCLQRRSVTEIAAGQFSDAVEYARQGLEHASNYRVPNAVGPCWTAIGLAEAFLARGQEALLAFGQARSVTPGGRWLTAVSKLEAAIDRISAANAAGTVGPAYASDPTSIQRELATVAAAFRSHG